MNAEECSQILICDDSPTIRASLTEALSAVDANVIAVDNGIAAIEQCRMHEFAVILMDVEMPGIDGYKTAARLRRGKKTRNIPIIFISSLDKSIHEFKGYEVGAVDFAQKPIEPMILCNKVKVFLELYQQRKQIERYSKQLERELELTHIMSLEIKEQQTMLDMALEYAGMGVWQWNVETDVVKQNSKLCEIFGIEESAAHTSRPFFNAIHPQDRDRVKEKIDQSLQSENGYEDTFRIVHNDGSERIVLAKGNVAHDLDEHTTTLTGITLDLTAREREKERLAVLSKALEAAANGIVITEKNGRIIWINKAFTELTGYSKHETLGKKPKVLKSGHHPPSFYKDLWKTILSGNVWSGIMHNLRKDGTVYLENNTITPVTNHQGEITHFISIKEDITEKERTRQRMLFVNTAIEKASESILLIGKDNEFVYFNNAFVTLSGYDIETLRNASLNMLFPEDFSAFTCQKNGASKEPHKQDTTIKKKDGNLVKVHIGVSCIHNVDDELVGRCFVINDLTERLAMEKEKTLIERQLRQAQKLESIGQLAAGIAHEINTPTQFVGDNLQFITESFQEYNKLLDQCFQLAEKVEKSEPCQSDIDALKSMATDTDLDFLKEEVPAAITQSLEGTARISSIVKAMKEFSHPSSRTMKSTDINHAIENTVTVARNEWKYVADVELKLDKSIPEVDCLPGELNQVILNIIVNAAHAIGAKLEDSKGEKGTITVSTSLHDDSVQITICDSGTGIPDHIRDKIFDPFFTTKEVGKGTGQGLAIAFDVIRNKHNGHISVNSKMGEGSEFIIRIPMVAQHA